MAVVLLDGGYPSFWNVDSAISIDVVGMKSYMDSLFDLMCESGGVTINKLNPAPNRNMPRFVSVLFNVRKGKRTRQRHTVCSKKEYAPFR